MKSVFLVIPHFIFTSDLLRTKYINYLSSKYRVVVISPMIDAEVARGRDYLVSDRVTYVKWSPEHARFWSLSKFLRIALVGEFDYLKSVKYFYCRPNYINNRRRRFIRGLFLPLTKILRADYFTFLETVLLPVSDGFKRLVEANQPIIMITATPGFDSFEAELIIQAKKAGLKTIAVNFTWDNLTMNCKHIRKTDYLIAWNDIMKKEAVTIHRYAPENVFVSGAVRFDPYFTDEAKEPGREEFLRSKGLNPNLKTILYTTVTRAYPFQKKYLKDILFLRDAGLIPHVNILVRIHPLDDVENYKEFTSFKDVCFDVASGRVWADAAKAKKMEMDRGDLLNLKYSLKYTDININYASTITLESCVFNKPVINIGYLGTYRFAYDFDHYRPVYASGAVRLVQSDDDLPELINRYLAEPYLDSEAREQITRIQVGFTDGLSYKRSVDFLEKII